MKVALLHTPIPGDPLNASGAVTAEERMISLRFIRGWMLADCDWTQMPDSPLSEENKTQWRIWRQEMRDITETVTEETVGDFFEVSDPPEIGLPSQWANWEYERFNEYRDALMAQQFPGHHDHG